MTRSLNQRIIGCLLSATIQQIIWNTSTVNGQLWEECVGIPECKGRTINPHETDDWNLRCKGEEACKNVAVEQESGFTKKLKGRVSIVCWVGVDDDAGGLADYACTHMNVFEHGGGSKEKLYIECGERGWDKMMRQGCSDMHVHCRSPKCTIVENHDVALQTSVFKADYPQTGTLIIKLWAAHSLGGDSDGDEGRNVDIYCPTNICLYTLIHCELKDECMHTTYIITNKNGSIINCYAIA